MYNQPPLQREGDRRHAAVEGLFGKSNFPPYKRETKHKTGTLYTRVPVCTVYAICLCSGQDRLTLRAVRYHGNLVADLLLDKGHIVLGLPGQVLKILNPANVAVPAL